MKKFYVQQSTERHTFTNWVLAENSVEAHRAVITEANKRCGALVYNGDGSVEGMFFGNHEMNSTISTKRISEFPWVTEEATKKKEQKQVILDKIKELEEEASKL